MTLRPRRLMAALPVFLVLLFIAIQARPALALCVDPPEDGVWLNTDSDTRGITRVDLRFVCQDQILNGEPYPPGPPWYMHLYGSCSPTDCDWGEVGA